MKNKTLILILILCQSFFACNEWLDVQPVTDVDLSEHISSKEGFIETLNGVYLNMADENLYGHQLMYGAVADVAQNYYTDTRPFNKFEYEGTDAKNTIKNIWQGLYNVIANNNIILDNIDDKKDLFVEADYNIIKGEALALRAFLHFDAIRLFGDTYEDAGEASQIPYALTFELVRYKHLSAEEVYTHILDDLDKAEEMLKNFDPIVAGASYNGNLFNKAKDSRKHHLNYYAVLALKARVYITMGDKVNALLYAQKVIDEFAWSWTPLGNLTSSHNSEVDGLFFDEVIAALHVQKLQDYYYENFEFGDYNAGPSSINYAKYIFEVNLGSYYWESIPGPGINDWRFLYLFDPNGSGELTKSIKYNQYTQGRAGIYDYQKVPLIRITEMMLIAAEAVLDTDKAQAIAYIEEIKEERDVILEDLSTLSEEEIMDVIVKEFRKETYLEGQLIYLYKRLKPTSILTMDYWGNLPVDVEADNFIFPLPDDELEFGNIPDSDDSDGN
ncbi:RagB/SusD family nutrient uptake outer membrane protein [Ancylomarina sp. DW003]|nr:RagB/SusD family nutrient uptake outer membrane protein [Ancylomarina sp. DW003]MDE5422863.1 RagB/SusD family nutrient uptake outer membrane protein [Ancylomarina sp. DW003]